MFIQQPGQPQPLSADLDRSGRARSLFGRRRLLLQVGLDGFQTPLDLLEQCVVRFARLDRRLQRLRLLCKIISPQATRRAFKRVCMQPRGVAVPAVQSPANILTRTAVIGEKPL